MSLIVVRLAGGLGNQMFQYATGLALAQRRSAALQLDTSSYVRDELRYYELASFNLSATIAEPETIARLAPKKKGMASWISSLTITGSSDPIPVYREPHFKFGPAVMDLPAPHALIGYWQSERYFLDAADLVRREFTASEPIEPENAAVAGDIAAVTAVSLHVRRGDYVTSTSANAVHGTCSLDYYRMAVEEIKGLVSNPHFFVFSDDPDWTRANLDCNGPTTFVASNPATRGFRDMQLMSLCQHHIIANSSFSWWGAWLNAKPEKIVVAPARWFATSKNDTTDLLPPSWIRV